MPTAAAARTTTTTTMTVAVTKSATVTSIETQTVISSATVETESTFNTSAVSPDGLQLQVALNSTSIQSHGEVAVHIELLNTLNRNVSLTVVTNDNISAWNEDDFLCSQNPSYSLVGFALFAGHFSPSNISAAGLPLQLAAPAAIPCPFRLGLNQSTFLPTGDRTVSVSYYGQTQEPPFSVTAEVNATTGYCVNSGSINCLATTGILGYWKPGFGYAGNMTLSSKNFTYFPLGEYTVVAADDWNQYVFATFDVL